jgi:hypothetical protein
MSRANCSLSERSLRNVGHYQDSTTIFECGSGGSVRSELWVLGSKFSCTYKRGTIQLTQDRSHNFGTNFKHSRTLTNLVANMKFTMSTLAFVASLATMVSALPTPVSYKSLSPYEIYYAFLISLETTNLTVKRSRTPKGQWEPLSMV